jgi:redox-sensitive bicupin YhaK (pirin superfamily)
VGSARLLAGPHPTRPEGPAGPFQTKQPVQILDLELQPGAAHDHSLPRGLNTCLLYVYRGGGRVNGAPAAAKEVVRLDAADDARRGARLEAGEEGLGALLFAGRRIGEPIVWHGPFVMTTKAEISAAFEAYQRGAFPPKRVPWDYRAGERGPSAAETASM